MPGDTHAQCRRKTTVYNQLLRLTYICCYHCWWFICAHDRTIGATALLSITRYLSSAGGYTWIGAVYCLCAVNPMQVRVSDT